MKLILEIPIKSHNHKDKKNQIDDINKHQYLADPTLEVKEDQMDVDINNTNTFSDPMLAVKEEQIDDDINNTNTFSDPTFEVKDEQIDGDIPGPLHYYFFTKMNNSLSKYTFECAHTDA